MNAGAKPRVVVISLDGATWDLLAPWCREGILPNIAALWRKGVWGVLESTIPPVTAPAWVSFQTGKNPGKHGFFHFTARRPDGYGTRTLNANAIQEPTLWRILSDQGRRVCAINVPMTFPLRAVNGCMISGMLTPDLARAFYPPELGRELLAAIGDYTIFVPIRRADFLGGHDFIQKMIGMIQQRTAAARYLLAKEDWDFFMVHFQATDIMQHVFWTLVDAEPPLHRLGSEQDRADVLSFYRTLDRLVGELIAQVEGQATLILMSDHGFGAGVKRFYMNQWLADQGYLKEKRALKTGVAVLEKIVRKADFLKLRRRLLAPRSKASQASRQVRGEMLTNWPQTRAFALEAPFYARIYLNVVGREPMGCVNPGDEYEALRAKIAAELMAVRDPDTGEPVIERVYKREEVYQGHRLEEMPDLIVQPCFGFMIATEFRGKSLIEATPRFLTGTHHRDGLLAMAGAPVKVSETVEGASILDLAPTILYLLGLPVPDDMDGKVLLDVMRPDFVAAHPAQYAETRAPSASEMDSGYDQDDAQEIEERLRALGYLD